MSANEGATPVQAVPPAVAAARAAALRRLGVSRSGSGSDVGTPCTPSSAATPLPASATPPAGGASGSDDRQVGRCADAAALVADVRSAPAFPTPEEHHVPLQQATHTASFEAEDDGA
ncbi:hypothetical protein EON68_00840 [archaeon]|nr:MAG: hypothetical protein EON68_00840 [archaeon]